MYLFVNTDLGMKTGKIAAQVGHAVQYIVENIVISGFEIHPPPAYYFTYMKWRNAAKKIVLKATQEQLLKLKEEPESVFVIDAGRTQIPENSLTVVGFYPSFTNESRFTDYKLM